MLRNLCSVAELATVWLPEAQSVSVGMELDGIADGTTEVTKSTEGDHRGPRLSS
jgi:hypothetical protein